MTVEEEERRGFDRRILELEKQMTEIKLSTALTGAKVDGLVETFKSRFIAFDRGLELILEKFKPLDGISALRLEERIAGLEMVKNQATGAMWVIKALGVTGIVVGIVAVFKMVLGMVVK